MVAAIVAQWHLPIDEVRSWTWSQLQRAHSQVNRERYDASIAAVQTVEAGQVRAYIATNGKQPQPFKTYDELNLDPWERTPPEPLSERQRRYLQANNLER